MGELSGQAGVDPYTTGEVNLGMARVARGWSVRELAGRAGVSMSTIHSAEHSLHETKQSTWNKLGVALGESPWWLMEEN